MKKEYTYEVENCLTLRGALTLRGLYLRLIPHSAGLFSSQYNNYILTWSNKQTNKTIPTSLFSNIKKKCSTRFFVWKRISNFCVCVVWKVDDITSKDLRYKTINYNIYIPNDDNKIIYFINPIRRLTPLYGNKPITKQ